MPEEIEATDTTEVDNDEATPEEPQETAEEPQTYSREKVEELRQESAKYRQRARDAEARADDPAKRLHTALVASTGRLQDADDLPYVAAHLESTEALSAAIDELLDAKPHLKARVAKGGHRHRPEGHC